jgi:hypothetical protein
MVWLPRTEYAHFRAATVTAVGSGTATIGMDGGEFTGVPVYGSAQVGDKVLVIVQGASLTVLGRRV